MRKTVIWTLSAFSVSQIFALYTWFPLAIILAVFLLIARFYERFSNRHTYYWFYTVPIVFYGLSAVRYAGVERVVGDFWGDVFASMAGIIFLALSTRLFWMMR